MVTKYRSNPKGFSNFTDSWAKRTKGYSYRIAKNPYSKRGEKVLFYKRKR